MGSERLHTGELASRHDPRLPNPADSGTNAHPAAHSIANTTNNAHAVADTITNANSIANTDASPSRLDAAGSNCGP